MLEKLTITGGACFGDDPFEVEGFQRINFFFGSNGSGKTTISRALNGYGALSAQPSWSDGTPLKLRVYNRDFVSQILKESTRIPGVFVIGKPSVEAEERLQTIESKGGEREKITGELTKVKLSLTAKQAANDEAQTAFQNTAWEAFKKLTRENPSLVPAFKGQGGVGNSKLTLSDKLLAFEATADPVPTLASLLKDADAVFDTTSTSCEELPKTPVFDMKSHNGFNLLSESVVGSDEVTLSELVNMLGNSDWVSDGRKYFERSDGICPFCQREAPHNFAAELETLFNDEYTEKKQQIKDFLITYETWGTSAAQNLDNFGFDSREFLDEAAYNASMLELRTEIDKNHDALRRKQRNPSSPVSLHDFTKLIEDVDSWIDSANVAIKAHNKLVSERKTEKPKLVKRCWEHLAFDVLKSSLANFRQQQSGRDKAIAALDSQVRSAQATVTDLDDEVRKLHCSVRSTQPVIDSINALLSRNGFTSFQIVPSEQLKDGYMLARSNGAVQENSLSEGERTFIAFLYYYHLLDEQPDESDDSHRTLTVIDDPVSSLDSDVLFIVGALVRRLVARAFEPTDHVEQVIILTHNVYFHKDVSHLRQGKSPAGRTYFVIRKLHDLPSEVTHHRKNPVTTEYRRLWDEVKKALKGEQMNVVGLENIMRRILESYFKVMGGEIWDDDITPLFDQSEQHVFQALFRWSNEGSHSILEEVFYSPTPITQSIYLNVFKRVFEVTGQDGHYKMMVQGKQSLSNHDTDQTNTPSD